MSATEVLEFQVVYYVCLNLTTPLRKVIRSAEDVGLGSILFANVHLTKKVTPPLGKMKNCGHIELISTKAAIRIRRYPQTLTLNNAVVVFAK